MIKKLILFGDSLFGEVRKTETLMLEEKLGGEYDIYNCATGGWSTNDLVKKAPYISGLKPDIVIISAGTNDSAPWKRVDLETFKSNLPVIAEQFSESRVIFFPPPPVTEVLLEENKIMSNEDVRIYNDAVIEFCKEASIGYIDSWSLFMKLKDNNQSYHVADGIHFTREGYELLFSELSEVVRS